jgi:SAM-dependent methyltransferase
LSARGGLAIPDLRERHVAPEIMDSPSLDRERHLQALDALARVNLLSLTAGRLWREVVRLGRQRLEPVRVLDVACGGGDVLVEIARRAERVGLRVECVGCDLSAIALERATRRAAGMPGVRFTRLDVLRDSLPEGHHVVCSTLFLHHLGREAAVQLLAAMAQAALRVVSVQDLRRTRLGYLLARASLAVLTRSDVARSDGPTSVAAALTLDEARQLCRDAGLSGAAVQPCWPQRWLLRWERQ